MDKNEEGLEEEIQEEVAEAEVAEEKDETDWKAKHDEMAARLKRAETKLDKTKIEKKVEEKLEEKKDELDETQLDYLDLKGVHEEDEINLIHNVMKRTGQTVRQALKDDYVLTKLNTLRKENEIKDATPGATRRAGGTQVNTVDYWLARYEQKGELPKDFKLRSEVVNKFVDRQGGNHPAWHSN